jgi:hypothetical protein
MPRRKNTPVKELGHLCKLATQEVVDAQQMVAVVFGMFLS